MGANAQTIQVGLQMTADTSQAKRQLQDLQQTLTRLMNTSTTSNKDFLGLEKSFASAKGKIAELQVMLKNSTNSDGIINMNKFTQQMSMSKNSIADFRKAFSTIGDEGKKAFNQFADSALKGTVQLEKGNGILTKFATNLKKVAAWQLSSSVIHGFMGGIQQAFSYAQQLDKSLNNIRIVTGQTTDQMAEFAAQANKAAQSLNTTTTAYTDAALIYYQAGLKGKDVTDRTDTTIKLANVTGQTASEVSSYMTAIWNNFDDGSESLEHYADVITNLGATTSSSSKEIAEGLGKFASVAQTVGLSYDYATSALATVVAQTRQSADTVGTAFKTLFARIQDLELGDEGTVEIGKYAQALDKVGISILDAKGNMLDMDSILNQMGEKWSTMSQAQQTALAQNVAGKEKEFLCMAA